MDPVQLPRRARFDTVELSYVDRGAGDAFLFLHAYTDSWVAFEEVMRHLPADVRAVAPSLRGHGKSPASATQRYSIELFAADVAAFLRAIDVTPACVVGHSMGAFVATELALKHPELVPRLALISPGLTLETPGGRALRNAVESLPPVVERSFVEGLYEGSDIAPARVRKLVDEGLRVPASVWKAVMSGIWPYDGMHRVGELSMPVLIVRGETDEIFDRAVHEDLLARLQHGRLRVFEGAGHHVHCEQPEAVARELLAFLRE